MATKFLSELSTRRSIYALGNSLPIPKKEVVDLIQQAVRISPSSFNLQSSRVVILFGEDHANFWKSVLDAMKEKGVSGDTYTQAEKKVNGCFASGAGTILFFEDEAAVEGIRKSIPAYAHNFGSWSIQGNAMAQHAVWTTLAQANIGASLQHYNELIEERTKKALNLPADWQIVAQMPFGSIAAPAADKTTIPDEGRFIVKGL